MLAKLDNTRFSEGEIILNEEKENLVEKYNWLIEQLQKEKETIFRQIEKDNLPFTPLRKKVPKAGYCYFCDVSISASFAYKLKKEEQVVLAIEVVEGAEFCSQECLLNYCKEYKKREKSRQDEEEKNKEKIANDRQLVTQIQARLGMLVKKINDLERKERELEITVQMTLPEEKKGFFYSLGQRLG